MKKLKFGSKMLKIMEHILIASVGIFHNLAGIAELKY
jgi:hypothetical protein